MDQLTPLLRRVLATLPRWHEDEAWLIAEEGGPEKSVRRHNLSEMHTEMVDNPHALVADGETGEPRTMTADEVQLCLDHLVAKGWATIEDVAATAEATAARYWRMTQEGFVAIHAATGEEINQVPGPVEIKPDPAKGSLSTQMEG